MSTIADLALLLAYRRIKVTPVERDFGPCVRCWADSVCCVHGDPDPHSPEITVVEADECCLGCAELVVLDALRQLVEDSRVGVRFDALPAVAAALEAAKPQPRRWPEAVAA